MSGENNYLMKSFNKLLDKNNKNCNWQYFNFFLTIFKEILKNNEIDSLEQFFDETFEIF